MTARRHNSCQTLFFIPCILALWFFLGGAADAAGAGNGITLDGSLGPKGPVPPGTFNLNGVPTFTNYLIQSNMGKQAGNNLFFSFGTFNVYTGESATFTGPGNIQNIISRVTGGEASTIDGLLRCTIDGANLFLLNPSGVMFGPNAQLDVSGSFHVSTADYLKFADGSVFYSNLNANSVLSVAAPEAFGFVSSNPAPISLDQTVLQVQNGNTISIVAGNITLVNDPNAPTYYNPDGSNGPTYNMLSAPGGRINVVGVASPGEVNLNDLDVNSFARLGDISFSNGANVAVSNSDYSIPAGTVVIRGGQISFSGSAIDASGTPGGLIDIKGQSLHMDNSVFTMTNYGNSDQLGAACQINVANEFLMTDASFIASSGSGQGRAGDILINASIIKLGDDTPGTGPYAAFGIYGDIVSTAASSGQGGNISISANNLTVQNGFYISADSLDVGNAGNVTVKVNSLQCLNQGYIGSNAFASGNGGTIEITAQDVLFSAKNEAAVLNSSLPTGITAQTFATANGGKIELNVDDLKILDGGKISTILYGSGQGSDLVIKAKDITVSGFTTDPSGYFLSSIDARVVGLAATGTGGNIDITSNNLAVNNYGAIRTALFPDQNGGAPGNAGNITINAGNIAIGSRGQIYADSFRGTGNSGDIFIKANDLQIFGAGNLPPSPLGIEFTGLSTTTNAGLGGTINLSLSGNLLLADKGGINANTQGTGPGGAIDIAAANIDLSGNSTISAASSGTGNAGNIDITVGNTFTARGSTVSTQASESDGGNIRFTGGKIVRLIDSEITTSVNGGPQTVGGNIHIDPDFVILENSRIVANAYEGKGGNIRIIAGTLLKDFTSVVDASSKLGVNGTVDISAPVRQSSAIVTPLPRDFMSAAQLLREPCKVRTRQDRSSSLIIKGRDGLPPEPGSFLPAM